MEPGNLVTKCRVIDWKLEKEDKLKKITIEKEKEERHY